MTVVRGTFVALLALALLLAVPTAASAKFTRTASASLAMSTDTLVPPTGVSITCNRKSGFVVRWTATSDTNATGYTINSSYFGISMGSVDVAGRTTVSYEYQSDVPWGTAIQLVSVVKSWTSAKTAATYILC